MNPPKSKTPLCFGGQVGSLNEANLLGSFVLGTFILAYFGTERTRQFCGVIR